MGKECELKAITANRVSPVIIHVLFAVEGAVVKEYLFLYSIPKHINFVLTSWTPLDSDLDS